MILHFFTVISRFMRLNKEVISVTFTRLVFAGGSNFLKVAQPTFTIGAFYRTILVVKI